MLTILRVRGASCRDIDDTSRRNASPLVTLRVHGNARCHPAEYGGQPRTRRDTSGEAFLRLVSSMSRQLAPLTRRIVSIPHRAGLLAPGSKRFSVRLPIQFRTVAGSLHRERMSCSPVTVARETAPDLHRLPYSAST